MAVVVLVGMPAVSIATVIPAPIAHYSFDGDANDASGNENHATIHGSGTTLTADRFGRADHAYEISGNSGGTGLNNWIELPNVVDGLTDLTISMWIIEESIGYIHGEWYINFGSPDSGVYLAHEISTNGQLDLPGYLSFTVPGAVVDTDFSDTWLGEFQHYALVYDGNEGDLRAYHNGSLVGESSGTPGAISAGGNAALGAHWWSSNAFGN